MNLGLLLGKFWWCLQVSDDVSTISLVVKKRAKNLAVLKTFSGSIDECRSFQCANGGVAEGVILIDDVTPIKIVFDSEAFEFPGCRREDFVFVKSVVEDHMIVASTRAVMKVAELARNAGFLILSHLPAFFYKTSSIEIDSISEKAVFVQRMKTTCDLWIFSDMELCAYYRISNETNLLESVRNFIAGEYRLDSVAFKEISLNNIALETASDAWTFGLLKMPTFPSEISKEGISRLKQAKLFRKTLYFALVVLVTFFIGIVALGTFNNLYKARMANKQESYELFLKDEKEFGEMVHNLERRADKMKNMLVFRSKIASQLCFVAAALPEGSWLSHWKVEGNKFHIQGLSMNVNDVSAFLSGLEKSGRFLNVRLRTTEKTTFRYKPVVRFEIVAESL